MSLLVLLMKKEYKLPVNEHEFVGGYGTHRVLCSALLFIHHRTSVLTARVCVRVFVFHVGISVFGTSGSFRASPTFTRNIANIKTEEKASVL